MGRPEVYQEKQLSFASELFNEEERDILDIPPTQVFFNLVNALIDKKTNPYPKSSLRNLMNRFVQIKDNGGIKIVIDSIEEIFLTEPNEHFLQTIILPEIYAKQMVADPWNEMKRLIAVIALTAYPDPTDEYIANRLDDFDKLLKRLKGFEDSTLGDCALTYMRRVYAEYLQNV